MGRECRVKSDRDWITGHDLIGYEPRANYPWVTYASKTTWSWPYCQVRVDSTSS